MNLIYFQSTHRNIKQTDSKASFCVLTKYLRKYFELTYLKRCLALRMSNVIDIFIKMTNKIDRCKLFNYLYQMTATFEVSSYRWVTMFIDYVDDCAINHFQLRSALWVPRWADPSEFGDFWKRVTVNSKHHFTFLGHHHVVLVICKKN